MKLIIKYLENNPHTLYSYKTAKNQVIIQTVFDEVLIIKKIKKEYLLILTTTIDGTQYSKSYKLNSCDIFQALYDLIFDFYRGEHIIEDYIEKKEVAEDSIDD